MIMWRFSKRSGEQGGGQASSESGKEGLILHTSGSESAPPPEVADIMVQGVLAKQQGRLQDFIAAYREAGDKCRDAGAFITASNCYARVGEAYAKVGDVENAMKFKQLSFETMNAGRSGRK